MTTTEPLAGELLTDRVVVRAAAPADLDAIVRIDAAAGGLARPEYLKRRLQLSLDGGGIRLALVAEVDGDVAGFLLGAVDYGEFGKTVPSAVIDALGVHPEARGRHAGAALLRQAEMQLRALGIETLRTEVDWSQQELLGFFHHAGFAPAPRIALSKAL